MTVEEVIKALEEFPKDTLVVQSSDAEGNMVRDFAEPSRCYAFEEDYGYELVADEDLEGNDPEYEIDEVISVVVLWPV